jgi:recombinational DNA repair ATPase RecF
VDQSQSVERDEASGRERELGRLLGALDEARVARRGSVVFVSGPAGIGKSHLLAAFRVAAVARGARVVEERDVAATAFDSRRSRSAARTAGAAGAPARIARGGSRARGRPSDASAPGRARLSSRTRSWSSWSSQAARASRR